MRLFQTVCLLESQENLHILQCREKCDTLLKNDDAWKIRHEKCNGMMVQLKNIPSIKVKGEIEIETSAGPLYKNALCSSRGKKHSMK